MALDIADFTGVELGQIPFGASNPKAIANALRVFADKVELGAIHVQKIDMHAHLTKEDFAEKELVITYCERR